MEVGEKCMIMGDQVAGLSVIGQAKWAILVLRYILDPTNARVNKPWVTMVREIISTRTGVPAPTSWVETSAWIDDAVATGYDVVHFVCRHISFFMKGDDAALNQLGAYFAFIRDTDAGPAPAVVPVVAPSVVAPSEHAAGSASMSDNASIGASAGAGVSAAGDAGRPGVGVFDRVRIDEDAEAGVGAGSAGSRPLQRRSLGRTSSPGRSTSVMADTSHDSDAAVENQMRSALAPSLVPHSTARGACAPLTACGSGASGNGASGGAASGWTNPLQCPECPYIATRASGTKVHVESVHNGRRFLCPVAGCGGSYAGMGNLVQHLMGGRHNMEDSAAANTAADGAVFGYTIRDPSTGKPTPGFEGLGPDRDAEVIPLRCLECPHIARRPSHAQRHVETVHNGRRFLCPVAGCGRSCTRKCHLVQHLQSGRHNMDSDAANTAADAAVFGYTIRDPATGKPTPGFEGLGPDRDAEVFPLQCPECPHIATRACDTKKHVAVVHNGLRFLCPVAGCGRSCTRKCHLVQHLQSGRHNMDSDAANTAADAAVSGYTIRDPATSKPTPGFEGLIAGRHGRYGDDDANDDMEGADGAAWSEGDEDEYDEDEGAAWNEGEGSASEQYGPVDAGAVSSSSFGAHSTRASARVKRPRDSTPDALSRTMHQRATSSSSSIPVSSSFAGAGVGAGSRPMHRRVPLTTCSSGSSRSIAGGVSESPYALQCPDWPYASQCSDAKEGADMHHGLRFQCPVTGCDRSGSTLQSILAHFRLHHKSSNDAANTAAGAISGCTIRDPATGKPTPGFEGLIAGGHVDDDANDDMDGAAGNEDCEDEDDEDEDKGSAGEQYGHVGAGVGSSSSFGAHSTRASAARVKRPRDPTSAASPVTMPKLVPSTDTLQSVQQGRLAKVTFHMSGFVTPGPAYALIVEDHQGDCDPATISLPPGLVDDDQDHASSVVYLIDEDEEDEYAGYGDGSGALALYRYDHAGAGACDPNAGSGSRRGKERAGGARVLSQKAVAPASVPSGLTNPLQCPECPFIATRACITKDHVESVHNGRRFLCPVAGCGGSYAGMGNLVQHLQSGRHNMDSAAANTAADGAVFGYTIRDPATGKPTPGFEGLGPDRDAEVIPVQCPVQCPVCPHIATRACDIKKHVAVVHNGRRFLCPVAGCGGSCTQKADLVQHLQRGHHNMGSTAANTAAKVAVSGYTIRDPATGKPTPGFEGLITGRHGRYGDDDANDDMEGADGAAWNEDKGSASEQYGNIGAGVDAGSSSFAAHSTPASAGVKRPRDLSSAASPVTMPKLLPAPPRELAPRTSLAAPGSYVLRGGMVYKDVLEPASSARHRVTVTAPARPLHGEEEEGESGDERPTKRAREEDDQDAVTETDAEQAAYEQWLLELQMLTQRYKTGIVPPR